MRPLPTTTAAILGLACLVAGQRAVEVEPNEGVGQAQPLAIGRPLAASLSTTADVDWFAFSLHQPQQVNLRVRTVGADLGRTEHDALVAIYDRSGQTRLAWNERSQGPLGDCGVTLPAGDYTCLVASKPTGAPGDYVLELAANAVRAIDVHEAPEPNDNPAHGGTPTAIVLGDTVAGRIDEAGDIDWFAFDLAQPGIVQVACLDDGGVPQLDNTRLQFWRETSPGIWSAFGDPSFLRTSHRAFDLTHTTHLPAGNFLLPGRYAIQVDANTSTPTGSAPWDYRKVGKYGLRTSCIALPGRGTVHEGPEPNGAASSAAPLSLGDDASGTIDDHGDVDWFMFEIDAPTTIGATAEGAGTHPVPVTSVRLWNADGTAMASGTGTAAAHGKLVHTVTEPGTYYLEVKARLFADVGGYLLHTGACRPLHLAVPDRSPAAATKRPVEASGRPGSAKAPVEAEPPATGRSQ